MCYELNNVDSRMDRGRHNHSTAGIPSPAPVLDSVERCA